jgi:amino acid permease
MEIEIRVLSALIEMRGISVLIDWIFINIDRYQYYQHWDIQNLFVLINIQYIDAD